MKSLHKAFLTMVFAFLTFPSVGFSTLYSTTLNGANEEPPNASTGTGFATVDFDTNLHLLVVEIIFSDLLSPTTAAHIHGNTASPGTGTAGVITQLPSFDGFPTGVMNGTYSHTFDTSQAATWNPTFLSAIGSISAAETALESFLMGGTSYLNIHTVGIPAGEIRGFFSPSPIPEPASILLLGTGITSLICSRRRRKSWSTD